MAKRDPLKQRITRAIIAHALFRLESALIIALTIIVLFFFPMPFPWWQWWYGLAFPSRGGGGWIKIGWEKLWEIIPGGLEVGQEEGCYPTNYYCCQF